MLCGLGLTIDVALLHREHIQQVGPLLLGQAAWKNICNDGYRDWHEFKSLVEECFGMTKTERHERFYRMRPEAAEYFGRFVQ